MELILISRIRSQRGVRRSPVTASRAVTAAHRRRQRVANMITYSRGFKRSEKIRNATFTASSRSAQQVRRKTLRASVENKTTLTGKSLESVRDIRFCRRAVGQRLRAEFMLRLKRSFCGTPIRTSSHSPLFSSPSLHTALTCNIRFHFCNLDQILW